MTEVRFRQRAAKERKCLRQATRCRHGADEPGRFASGLACWPLGATFAVAGPRDAHVAEHVRPVQDRHRPVQLAHGGADAGGRAIPARARDATACWSARHGSRPLLYGSLALTGKGHATDKAIILGLCGELPDRVDPDAADGIVAEVRASGRLPLLGRHPVPFDEAQDLQFLQRENSDPAPQRHPLSRLRRGRCRAAAGILLLGRRRIRAQRAGGRGRPGGRVATSPCRSRSPRPTSCWRCAVPTAARSPS